MGLRLMDPTYGRAMSVGHQLEQRMVSPIITAQRDPANVESSLTRSFRPTDD